jgi:hypothetical protein
MPAKKEKTEKTEKAPKASGSKSPKKKTSADKALAVPKRMTPTDTKRKVKQITRYSEGADASGRGSSEIVIKKGKGKKFEECDQIMHQINKRTRDDEVLRMVHGILLGRVNKKVPVKNNLKEFSGVHYDDEKGREHLEAKFDRHKLRDIREMAKFFGVEHEGEKEEVVKRIVDFLEKPHSMEIVHSPSKKRKRSKSRSRSRSRSSSAERSSKKKSSSKKSSSKKSSSKKSSSKKSSGKKSSSKKSSGKKSRKKKDPNAPKRPLSAYMIFAGDKREEAKKKLGKDAKITEVASLLGKMWKKVDEDEKKKYQKKAAKLKEAYEKDMKKYKKGGSSSDKE